MPADNPFRPGFGVFPPEFVGREDIEDAFAQALQNGPGARAFTSIVTGARGLGKTVLLAELRDRSADAGFVSVSVDANTGMLANLHDELNAVERLLDESLPGWTLSKLRAGAGALGLTAEAEFTAPAASEADTRVNLRSDMSRVVRKALDRAGGDGGLLLTVDELQAADPAELERLGNDLQHVVQEFPVAFVGAALPNVYETIFARRGATFFVRATRFELGPLTTREAFDALAPPFENAGVAYERDVMMSAARSTNGHPYMIQLLGSHMWSALPDLETAIDQQIVDASLAVAQVESVGAVLEPTWNKLSQSSRDVLSAVAQHRGEPVRRRTIQDALSKSHDWFSTYRARLIKDGVLEAAGRGEVRLTGGEYAAKWILTRSAAESWGGLGDEVQATATADQFEQARNMLTHHVLAGTGDFDELLRLFNASNIAAGRLAGRVVDMYGPDALTAEVSKRILDVEQASEK